MKHLNEIHLWTLFQIVVLVLPIRLNAKGTGNLPSKRENQNRTYPYCDSYCEIGGCYNNCPYFCTDCEYYCWSHTTETEDPYPTTTPYPTFRPTTYPPETSAATTSPTTTLSPPIPQTPKFTRAFYQASVPGWPIAGTIVHLGINASTHDGEPIQYKLVSTFDFLSLSPTQDMIFTSTVSEGAFVGPNNVMLAEVVAEVIGWEEISNSATIAIVFPRPRAKSDKGKMV